MISKRNSRLYIVTQFLHSLVFTIPIWIVFYQGRLTSIEISILVAFQYFIQVIGELPTGAFADLLGKRLTSILGFFFGSISFLLFPLASSFSHFMVLAALVGIADSLLSGSVEALVYDSLKQDGQENMFSKVLGKQALWYQIGLVSATFLGGFLYSYYYGLPYILYGLSLLSAFVLSFFFVEPTVDSEKFTLRNYLRQIKFGSKEAFKNKPTASISLFYILVGAITWTCALYFNGYVLVELGFSNQERGVIDAALRLGNILILTNLIKNSHIFTEKLSILFFPIIMVFSLLPGFLLQGWIGVPFVAGGMMASTARWMILTKYTNQAFDSKYRATAISLLSMLIGVLYIIITFTSGPIISLFSVKWMYTLLGILTLITVFPLSLYLVKRYRFS